MRLIDADKLLRFFTVDTANQTYRFGTIKKQIENAETVKAIVIPDNATNGDMIEAMFPDYKFTRDGCWIFIGLNGRFYSFCPKEFWDASFKRGSEDESNS